jgi:hypothetical protein
MTESGGWLRLKVFEAHTEQILNVMVTLRPGAGPMPITVTGRLKVRAVAIGAETTGITLTTTDGRSYDLDFGARLPDRGIDGRVAVVSGVIRVSPGPERRGRRIIRVTHFRLVGGGRPMAEGDPRRSPFRHHGDARRGYSAPVMKSPPIPGTWRMSGWHGNEWPDPATGLAEPEGSKSTSSMRGRSSERDCPAPRAGSPMPKSKCRSKAYTQRSARPSHGFSASGPVPARVRAPEPPPDQGPTGRCRLRVRRPMRWV